MSRSRVSSWVASQKSPISLGPHGFTGERQGTPPLPCRAVVPNEGGLHRAEVGRRWPDFGLWTLDLSCRLGRLSGRLGRVGAGGCPAHTPLRTVRESFPSYGSSLHKAGPSILAGPLPSTRQVEAEQLGSTRQWPLWRCSFSADAPGRINRRASVVICFSRFNNGSTDFLAISDQTDVGISSALHTGIGFFGHPNTAPPDPPCGEVCPVASRDEVGSVSMFRNSHGMI